MGKWPKHQGAPKIQFKCNYGCFSLACESLLFGVSHHSSIKFPWPMNSGSHYLCLIDSGSLVDLSQTKTK